MTILDTALLIQSPVAPAPTNAVQSKSSEGFQQELDEATSKASSPVPQAKPATTGPRAASKNLRSVGVRGSGEKPSTSDATGARGEAQPPALSTRARSEAGPGATGGKATTKGPQHKKIEKIKADQADSTERQDLPSDRGERASETLAVSTGEDVLKAPDQETLTLVAQTPSVGALLASLLLQTTGDLQGKQIVAGTDPHATETSETAAVPALEAAPVVGPSAAVGSWAGSLAFISPDVPGDAELDGAPVTETQTAASQAAKDVSLSESTNPSRLLRESVLQARMNQASAEETKIPQSAPDLVTGQEVGPAEPTAAEPVFQDPVERIERAAASEKPRTLITGHQQEKKKEATPEVEARSGLLPSASLAEPGAETATGSQLQQQPSDSDEPKLSPRASEGVRSSRVSALASQEVIRAHGADTEKDFAKASAVRAAVEETTQGQATHTNTARDVLLNAPTASEMVSSIPNISEPAASTLIAPATRETGISHRNVNWTQVEKAQVVSQIVERAQLLGKNQSELMVVLKPEFLGRVNLRAAIVESRLVATIIAESASVKQMLEGQIKSLQTVLHEQGLPVARVEVIQGSQLSFADLGTGHSSSQQQLQSGKPHLPPALHRYETPEETIDVTLQHAPIYAPTTSRSLNLVA